MKSYRKSPILFTGFWPYAVTAILIVVAYALFAQIIPLDEAQIREMMAVCLVTLSIAFMLTMWLYKKDRVEILIVFIIAAGFIMRIGYMLYTSILVRAHDICYFNEYGHLDYVYQIFSTGTLPTVNDSQFYHPPLQHILQAIVVKVFSWISPNTELLPLFESAKIVPCFATCSLLFVIHSLCRELGLNRKTTAIALAILAFQPTFFLLSSSINNDALMLFFYMTAVLYTIRWYHQPSMKNIILLALAIGCGMMTKISAATVAFFTAPVFLIALIQKIKEKNIKQLIGQFAAFIGISAPLGLWYPIRNYIKFAQPFNFVREIEASGLFCSDKTFVSRFLSFPIDEIFSPLYCEPFGDFRLWIYTLKCSIFGEYDFTQHQPIAKLLILANLILILLSLISMVYVVATRKEIGGFARFGLAGLWVLQIGFFVLFNIQYPYGCTMDYRYMVPTCIIGAIFIAIALNSISQKRKMLTNLIYIFGIASVLLFICASMLFYVV